MLKDRDDFYEGLEEAIRSHEKNQQMLIGTDHFNAKAGSAYSQYKDEIEKYWKELKNSNGDTLLQPQTSTSNNIDS